MRKRNSDQRGQSMVLITLAMVGLIAFLALVVDGGVAFAARREMQNAADAGALAGVRSLFPLYYDPDKTSKPEYEVTIYNQVIQYAQANGVDDPADVEAWFIDSSQAHTGSNPLPGNGGVPADAVGVEVTTTTSFPSFFATVIGRNELGASALAASILEEEQCGGSYAVWADSCDPTCGADLTGSYVEVNGSVHSNSDAHLTGSDVNVTGAVEYCLDFVGDEADCGSLNPWYDDWCTCAKWIPRPWYGLDIKRSRFDLHEGGDLADLANRDTRGVCQGTIGGVYQNTCYHYFEGDLQHQPTDGDWPDGLYYVEGDVTFNGNYVSGCDLNITIVATGKIKMENVDGSTLCAPGTLRFTAYTDVDDDGSKDLLLFSNKWDPESRCNPWIIDISSSATLWTGIIFAPYGSIDISGSNLTSIEGAVWGYTVNLSGSYQSIGFKDEFCGSVIAPDVFLIR